MGLEGSGGQVGSGGGGRRNRGQAGSGGGSEARWEVHAGGLVGSRKLAGSVGGI